MHDRSSTEQAQAILLRRISQGDKQALSDFYDQVAAPLFSVALQILRDPGDAEEVIQDVFVQVWEKAATFDAVLGSAFHWTLSITRHRAIDRLRSRARRARVLDEFQEQVAHGFTEAPELDKTLASDEAAAVRSALGGLPPEQRQALELAFFTGKTQAEVAEALNQPLGTVKARIRRGLLKLRENLQAFA